MNLLSQIRLVLASLAILLLVACSATGTGQPEAANPPDSSPESTMLPPDAGSVTAAPEETAEDITPAGGADDESAAAQEETADIPACSTDFAESFQAGLFADQVINGDDRSARLTDLTSSWRTDWTLHTIDYGEVLSGGPPRDGIPSINDPHFVTIASARDWLAEREPVIALDLDGDVRAYPLQIATWHEIINDVVCGIPVAVTFCPLCNSALAFDRRVNGEVYEFGVSGLLRNSDLIMYDRTTESLWQQFAGTGIVGEHAGDQLGFIPISIISFAEFRTAHPEGIVLSQNTGHFRNYGINPYANYDSLNSRPFLFTGTPDPRLPAMRRVVGLILNDEAAAYPYDLLARQEVIHDTVGGQDVVIFYEKGTASALGAAVIESAADVGAATVYEPVWEGQALTFYRQDEQFHDNETDSVWNLSGQAVSGELEGAHLTPVLHSDHFWFSWAAFYPETRIYGQD